MGKQSRARREKMKKLSQLRSIDHALKVARFYDHCIQMKKHGKTIEGINLPNLEFPILSNIQAVIDGSVGAEYFSSIFFGDRKKSPDIRNMPVLPPFDEIFIEFKPNFLYAFGEDRSIQAAVKIRVVQCDEDESWSERLIDRGWKFNGVDPISSDTKYLLECWFIESYGAWKLQLAGMTEPARYPEHWDYAREPDRVVQLDINGLFLKSDPVIGNDREYADEVDRLSREGTIDDELNIALWVLAFINTRNIQLVDHEPSPELSRAFQEEYGEPLVKYKTLAVHNIQKRHEPAGEQKEYQGLMPLHIRRGNFATYTDDAPLFGKYVGTFWRPATAVGEEKRGVVVKDYKVVAE